MACGAGAELGSGATEKKEASKSKEKAGKSRNLNTFIEISTGIDLIGLVSAVV